MSSSCVVKLKVQFCMLQKRFEECFQKLTLAWDGPGRPCKQQIFRKFLFQDVGGSGHRRIGMGYMNLVTVIT